MEWSFQKNEISFYIYPTADKPQILLEKNIVQFKSLERALETDTDETDTDTDTE